MLRFLADENLNNDIVRGLSLRAPSIDIVVQNVGLTGATDPEVLRWADENNRIVLTHDRATMPQFAYELMAAGHATPGVFILNDRFPVGRAIHELLLLDACSEQLEWEGQIVHLPL